MIKKEPIQIARKIIECNLHGNPIKYKCQQPNCSSPYLCSQTECIENHFHQEERAILGRFNCSEWESKLVEVENVINDDRLEIRERYLAKLVDYFQSHFGKIQEDLKKYSTMKNMFSLSNSLNVKHLQEVNGLLSLGSKIDRGIDKLRAKIIDQDMSLSQSEQPQREDVSENEEALNLENGVNENQQEDIPEPQSPAKSPLNNQPDKTLSTPQKSDKNGHIPHSARKSNEQQENPYNENAQLTAFLEKHINNFTWEKTEVIFRHDTPFTTCEKFHEKLRDKEGLLFLFVGEEGLIIGSFYSEAYPSVAQRHKRDTNSFIFIEDKQLEGQFAHFVADPECDFHISVSEKLLICQGNTPNNGDGLRTFQRNFDNLVYFLPSRSFKDSIEDREMTYNGMLKVRQFYVLQIS